jgi:hypothetical protein
LSCIGTMAKCWSRPVRGWRRQGRTERSLPMARPHTRHASQGHRLSMSACRAWPLTGVAQEPFGVSCLCLSPSAGVVRLRSSHTYGAQTQHTPMAPTGIPQAPVSEVTEHPGVAGPAT